MSLGPRLPILLLAMLVACNGPGTEPRSPQTPAEDESWRSLAAVPTPRTEVAAATDGRMIYVMGGFVRSGETSATVEIYDPQEDSWSEGPPLPHGVNHAMAAATADGVYLFGGFGQGLSSPTDRAFVLQSGRWDELPRMPEPRGAGGAALVEGLIYIAGGVGPAGLADGMMIFDPSSSKWSTADGPPTRREHLAVAGGDGRVFVLGGRTGGIGSNLITAEAYDVRSRRWEPLAEMPTARGGSAGAFWKGGLAISAGGEAEATFDEVEAYELDTRSWLSLPLLPTARHGVGVVVLKDTLYVLAGGTTPGLSVSGANEALDLRFLGE